MASIYATVGILTFNSGKVLRRALESVKEFDDILVCDGGSDDDTLEIARAYGARIITQDPQFKNPDGTLNDFGGVRQQCIDAAKYDWFLYIDSDETISDGLREEIRTITAHPYTQGDPLVYRVPYGMMIDERPVLHASNYPGYQYRFFNRQSNARFIKKVHERITFDKATIAIGTLHHPWYTYSTRANAWKYLHDTREYRQLEVRAFSDRSFSDYFRFIVLRGLRTSVGAFLKALRNYLVYGFRDSAPVGDEFGRMMSPLLLIGDVTLAHLDARVESFLHMSFRSSQSRTTRELETITVFTIPAKLTKNPYLGLLYEQINGKSYDNFLFSVESFSFNKLFAALFAGKRSLVHVHWETNIYGSRSRMYSLVKMAWKFPLLHLARAFGARIVWTLHNLRAHDYPSPHIDALGRFFMRHLAQATIIQNEGAAELYFLEHRSASVIFIPHGNYVDAYGPMSSDRQVERSKLNLPADKTILLSLGEVRPYKKQEVLVDLVREAADQGAPVMLLIAGKGEPAYMNLLHERTGDSSAIRIIPGFVPDADIPKYYAAADYTLFAHGASSLTSGGLLLSLSYGLPAITLPMPAAELILEGENGYVVSDIAALKTLLSRIHDLPQLDRNAIVESVAPFSWERVGEQTRELFASLWQEESKM